MKKALSFLLAIIFAIGTIPALSINSFAESCGFSYAGNGYCFNYKASNDAQAKSVYELIKGQTSSGVAQKLYDLIFSANYRVKDLGGANWCAPNSGSEIKSVYDSGLGQTVYFNKSSKGCLSYAYFVSQYSRASTGTQIYIHSNSNIPSVAETKAFFNSYADPGEQIRFHYGSSVHSVAYLASDNDGFYFLSENGNGLDIRLYYVTWQYFSSSVLVYSSNSSGGDTYALSMFDTNGGKEWIVPQTAPSNCVINANYTSIGVGDTVEFTYNINNATTKTIGIDNAGSTRYDTIEMSANSGKASYTFNQAGLYCCIIEGYNSSGYACSAGVYVKVINTSPVNCLISSDKNIVAVGDTVDFDYNIIGATVKCIGIDSNGSRFASSPVSNDTGTAKYTFNKVGTYCCIIEGYNNIGYNCSSGVYITVVDKAPINCMISSNESIVGVGDKVSFTYNIVGATVKCIGIDSNSSRFASLSVASDNGIIEYAFDKAGIYCCIVEGYNNIGYNCSPGIYITVVDKAPEEAKLSIIGSSASEYKIGAKINFELLSPNTKTRLIRIFKNDIVYKEEYLNNNTYSCIFNEIGSYKVSFKAINPCGETISNILCFKIVGSISVSYNANGGAGAPVEQIKTEGTDLTLSTQIPTRYGYTFLGWSTDKNATSPTYLSGGAFTADEETVLYAVWGACDHSCGKTLTSYSETHPHYAIYKCNNCEYTSFGTETQKNMLCPECIFDITAIDETKCKITGYTGGAGEMVIPSQIGDLNVYSTNTGAFKNNTEITSVIIEEGITEIGGLTFMGCSNLKKAVIPASVTTMGAFPFYDCSSELVIYCFKGSAAYDYAVANSIDYVIMTFRATEKTEIDFENNLIFTTAFGKNTLAPIITPVGNVTLVPIASKTIGTTEIYGTGSEITAFDNNTLVADYTIIVCGDLNKDGVCDILDVFETENFAQNRKTPERNQIYAANSAVSDEITAASYQNVVNTALK